MGAAIIAGVDAAPVLESAEHVLDLVPAVQSFGHSFHLVMTPLLAVTVGKSSLEKAQENLDKIRADNEAPRRCKMDSCQELATRYVGLFRRS